MELFRMQDLGTASLRARIVVAALLAGLATGSAVGSNGLDLIGFGTESSMMGGADVAVARDTTALNTNPAGLSQLTQPAFDAYNAAAFALDVGHRDALGNDVSVSNRIIGLGGGGYARPLVEGVTDPFPIRKKGGREGAKSGVASAALSQNRKLDRRAMSAEPPARTRRQGPRSFDLRRRVSVGELRSGEPGADQPAANTARS
ncbi:MAG: hypothetical protein ABI920_10430 [Casimicrobiaceae bacterium]